MISVGLDFTNFILVIFIAFSVILLTFYVLNEYYHRKIPKVILWTAPRCVSTAFERAIVEIPNGKILHEPFSIPYYFGPQKISKRYINNNNNNLSKITYNDTLNILTKSYEIDKNIDFVFSKDMAYYITQFHSNYYYSYLLSTVLSSPDFIHTFLIRRPDKAIISLYKASLNEELTGWNFFDKKEIGFNDIQLIYNKCIELKYNNLIIIDADDLLSNPSNILKKYCNKVGLKYNDNILTWKPGQIEAFKLWDGWHDDVINSNGFKIKTKQEMQSNEAKLKYFKENVLPKDVQNEIKKAFVIYNQLYEKRLY